MSQKEYAIGFANYTAGIILWIESVGLGVTQVVASIGIIFGVALMVREYKLKAT